VARNSLAAIAVPRRLRHVALAVQLRLKPLAGPKIPRMDHDSSRLAHYTSSVEVIASILTYGFLLVPNKRYLINALLGEDLFNEREPQEFGMVSFTQLRMEDAAAHRDRFGTFGIIVSWDWALRNDAQRVVYVDVEGPVASELVWLFRFARQEFERAAGGTVDARSLENKVAAAFARSTLWSRLLTLYEYMEPERNSAQIEWRIANRLPQYHSGATRSDVVRSILEAVKLWKKFGSVRITPNDVHGFICPRGELSQLRSVLPTGFQNIPILTYRSQPALSRFRQVHEQALRAHRLRERLVTVVEPPPEGSLRVDASSSGGYNLPEVAHIEGARLFQDELNVATRVQVQYRSVTGSLCDVVLPIRDALYLLNALRELQWRSGLDPLNPLDENNRPRDVLVGRMRIGMSDGSRRRRREAG